MRLESEMQQDQFRFFIEFQSPITDPQPRALEDANRRAAAAVAIENLRVWLRENGLERKVSTMGTTMFGQVQITCAPEVIQQIRNFETLPIIAIRNAAGLSQWQDVRYC